MNLAEFSIKNQLLSVIGILLALFGGWNAYQSMPRFEDPEFTIRTALIFTQYPGASPEEVAREVSEPLETALQQMQEVKSISTTSSTGLSEISVDIKFEFSKSKEDLQIIWTKLRNKIKTLSALCLKRHPHQLLTMILVTFMDYLISSLATTIVQQN